MDFKAQTETELEGHIVTMLFALACLADRASHASHPVRAFVLWLLRRAETAVRECVAGQPMAIRAGNDPADALDLAASLRALARAVGKLAAQYQQFYRRRWQHGDACEADGLERHAAGRRHRDAIARPRSSRVNLAATPCPDTS